MKTAALVAVINSVVACTIVVYSPRFISLFPSSSIPPHQELFLCGLYDICCAQQFAKRQPESRYSGNVVERTGNAVETPGKTASSETPTAVRVDPLNRSESDTSRETVQIFV